MNFKKILALLLAAIMVLAMVASCAKNPADDEGKKNPDDDQEELTYDEISKQLYDENLGEFYKLYAEAKKEKEDLDKRFALMALAEAKLLESGVMLPTTTEGGRYAVSRVAPYTATRILWGNDKERFHNVVVTTEFITAEDRAALKAKWNELKGSGTWEDYVKTYLTEKGYTLKDSYTFAYSSDPVTWDILATSQANDSDAIVNTYDGLYEYDSEGVMQPALAESYTVSDDGLVYTFKLRQGLSWVDSQGRKVADVKADDFVAGMQHMMDAAGGLEYLVDGVIVNASEYINKEIKDFAEVGVKAVDDYTVEYTLTEKTTYFDTMLGYGVFAPMSREYYASQGGKFGAEYNPEDESYTYGKTPNNIAYCGPYVVTNATEKNTIVFKANESYWNKDNINLKSSTWLYNDSTDATKSYVDAVAGTIDGAGLTTAGLERAKQDGNFEKYGYVSDTTATTFSAFTNINRAIYANSNDDTKLVSEKTDDQKAVTIAAMKNVHFRRALAMAVDRATYNAQDVGEEVKLNSVRNSYTPGTFVYLEKETTVDVNGTATTFAAGTAFGAIIQAQLDADKFPVKVWDEESASGDGFDGWLNVEAATAELETAIKELAEDGVTVDAEHPIVLDLPTLETYETYLNKANAYKQSVEKNLGGKVVVNVVRCSDTKEWMAAGYTTQLGSEANYDVYDLSGWGPDYGDPQTYLDTFLPEGAGYMVKCIGIY